MSRRALAPGATLLGLLMGMGLGGLVMGVALSVWQTAQQNGLALAAQQQLYHNARSVMQALLQQAELATAAQLVGVAGSIGVAWEDDSTDPHVRATDALKGSDTLSLSHWRNLDDLDCQGNRNSTQPRIRNQFQRSTSTVNDFACKDTLLPGSTYQALAEGVVDFQVWLAEVSAEGQRLQWRTPSPDIDGQRVVAVAWCMQVISTTRVSVATMQRKGCADEPLPADGFLHQRFHRLVRVRRVGAFDG